MIIAALDLLRLTEGGTQHDSVGREIIQEKTGRP